jgi:hypothetical protein
VYEIDQESQVYVLEWLANEDSPAVWDALEEWLPTLLADPQGHSTFVLLDPATAVSNGPRMRVLWVVAESLFVDYMILNKTQYEDLVLTDPESEGIVKILKIDKGPDLPELGIGDLGDG